ncbi:MAG: transcription antitermination factor NusB [Simkaniaceae bacterium]|nr:transcription antitermination factor NusB [Simkaniaceae bacterium]
MPKKQFRELVLQTLYAHDFNHDFEIEELHPQHKGDLLPIEERFKKIVCHLPKIDEWITTFSKDYVFSRISAIEKNVLRLAVFEMVYDDEIPLKVAISEAIRLTRKYGTHEGGSYVNAILDTLSKEELK